MRLQKCNLDADVILAAPVLRNKPPFYWKNARDKEFIPVSLYLLYHNADYCSPEKAPKYLSDPERKLFSYFGIVLNALLSCFVESKELLDEIEHYEELDYTPIKRAKGKKWDENASKLQGRAFKLFILELLSVLDLLSELVALLLPGIVGGLKLGSSMYSYLDIWLSSPLKTTSSIIEPKEHYAEKLHDALNNEKIKDSSETDWYDLLRLYRNKLAHLGVPSIRKLVFHDSEGNFYKFIPKSWPFLWEKDLKFSGESIVDEDKLGPDYFEKILIHEDIVSFCKNCRLKIFSYINAGLTVLNEAYKNLKDMPLNSLALKHLEGNERNFNFKHFANSL